MSDTNIFRRAFEILQDEGPLKLAKSGKSYVIRMAKRSLYQILSLIFALGVKRDERLILFSTLSKRGYEGNCRFIFDYLLDQDDFNVVWVANNKSEYDKISSKGLPCVYHSSITALYFLHKANVGIVDSRKKDLSAYPSIIPDELSIVMASHGDGIAGGKNFSPEKTEKRKKRKQEWDYRLTTSEFARDFKLRMDFTEDEIKNRENEIDIEFKITGSPKNDYLLECPPEFGQKWDSFTSDIEPDTVILYAPTKHYHDDSQPAVDFFPFEDFSPTALHNFLQNENTLLLLRPHPKDVIKMNNRVNESYERMGAQLKELRDSPLVKLATQNEYSDVTMLLPFVDILIADYSAIYHDFLLLDRPIFFVPYDYEEYKEKKGFLYDYYDHLPGREIQSFEEFTDGILDVKAGKDEYQSARHDLRDKIHKYQDARSRERVAEFLRDITGDQ